MKIATFASWKGGAGKSTALMAAACSLVAQGRRIALFESDPNATLRRWRQNAIETNTWDDLCEIYVADEMASFERSYDEAFQAGYKIALVDTQGGATELNNAILANSKIVIIPTALTSFDIDSCMDTFDYALELLKHEEDEIPIAVLLQRMPVGHLTVGQKSDLALLDGLPQFEARFHNRDAFARMKARGMLHKLHALLTDDPGKRINAGHVAVAMKEADDFARDLMDVLDGEAADAA